MSRFRRCDWCQKPFDETAPLTIAERERLNMTLFVEGPAIDATRDRPICPICYGGVVGSAPRRGNNVLLEVGQSNTGPGNLLLRKTYGA